MAEEGTVTARDKSSKDKVLVGNALRILVAVALYPVFTSQDTCLSPAPS